MQMLWEQEMFITTVHAQGLNLYVHTMHLTHVQCVHEHDIGSLGEVLPVYRDRGGSTTSWTKAFLQLSQSFSEAT